MSSKIPSITQLSSRIIRVLGMNPGPMTLQGTNTYILGTGARRLLLDTGEPCVMEYIDNLKNVLSKECITLEHIVLSHWHMDHVGGLKDIYEHIKPEGTKIWKFKRSESDEDDKEMDFMPENETLQYLIDGQQLKVEGATLRVIHTPGHTTDHIILQLEEENAIFSGDCILGESTAVFSDLIAYLKSLRLIKRLKPDVIYPAHGPVINEPLEWINYYIKHREEREQSILKLLEEHRDQARSVEEIVNIMYGNTSSATLKAAIYVVGKHLVKLLREGKVMKNEKEEWQIKSGSKL